MHCNRFEKKIHDLELTRTISLQMVRMAPAEYDTAMCRKSNDTLVNTIPLKSQMVLAIGVKIRFHCAAAETSDLNSNGFGDWC